MNRLIAYTLLPILFIPSASFAAKGGRPTADNGVIEVNCSSESLQAAINHNSGNHYKILVTGTCRENLFIQNASVTIEGNPSATIQGTAVPENANAVVLAADSDFALRNISIRNSGINANARGLQSYSSIANLENVSITGFPRHGFVMDDSIARVADSEFSDNKELGVYIGKTSHMWAWSSLFNRNDVGVRVDRASSAQLYGATISSNRFGAAVERNSSLEVADCSNAGITGNSEKSFEARLASVIEINNCLQISSPKGGADIGQGSTIRLDNTKFSGGEYAVNAGGNSTVILNGSNSFENQAAFSLRAEHSSTIHQWNAQTVDFNSYGYSNSKAIVLQLSATADVRDLLIQGYDGPSIVVDTASTLNLNSTSLTSTKGSSAPDIRVTQRALVVGGGSMQLNLTNGIQCGDEGKVANNVINNWPSTDPYCSQTAN